MRKTTRRLTEKRNRFGYVREIDNPRGTKSDVRIAETREGFTAENAVNHRKIGTVKSHPEAYGRKLARQGHKKVTFAD